jgi:hypothetical protein
MSLNQLIADRRKRYLSARVESLRVDADATVNGNLTVDGTIDGDISEPLYTSDERALISGQGNTIAINTTNMGCATVGGQGRTYDMVNSDGAVAIGCNVNFDSAINTVAVGGTGNIICRQINQTIIGARDQDIRIEPFQPNIFMNGNPVQIRTDVLPGGPGVLTGLQLLNGAIRFAVGGAYTLDTAENFFHEVYDQTSFGYLGAERAMIKVLFYNSSGVAVTVAPGS